MVVGTWVAAPNTAGTTGQPIPDVAEVRNIEALGNILYTDHIFFFQIAGMILLVAMVGAIVLTLRHKPSVRRQNIATQVGRDPKTAIRNLILLSVNLNFVAFSQHLGDLMGQVFALFVLTVAAAEAAIGLAILVVFFRNKGSIAVEDIQNPLRFLCCNGLVQGDLNVNWALRIDTLTVVMLVVVNTVSSLVHMYSIGYMHHDPHRPRFFAYLSLFTFAMLMLVTSDNLLQMFFGWEGVGLASYLLIGFWFKKPSANAAAIKAFVVNRVGDFGFALGIFGVFFMFNTIEFSTIFANVETVANAEGTLLNFLGYELGADAAMTIVCLAAIHGLQWLMVRLFSTSSHTAFFKALLFLGAGSVIHAVSDEQDMRKMGGLRKHIPKTYWMMMIGTVALTGLGIPGTLLFLASDFHDLSTGKPRASVDVMSHVHESPNVMLIPLYILAAGALLAGFVFHDAFVGHATGGHHEGWYNEFWRTALYAAENNKVLGDIPRCSKTGEMVSVYRNGNWLCFGLVDVHQIAIPCQRNWQNSIQVFILSC
ncbi:NADH-quinone oxidoreductase subunit L [Nymphon striatum]|nr:NADH-quinone oxidoreductase subunit L [Nymphon striatum]